MILSKKLFLVVLIYTCTKSATLRETKAECSNPFAPAHLTCQSEADQFSWMFNPHLLGQTVHLNEEASRHEIKHTNMSNKSNKLRVIYKYSNYRM